MRFVLVPVLLLAACGGSETSHTTKPPIVHIGTATQVKPYDKASIQRTIEAQRDPIRACYEHALATQPGLSGRVAASFVIGLDGKAVNVSATGMDPGVASCVAAAIEAMTFDKPDGGVVSVTYPFEFAPPAPAGAATP
jgi:hypothetical protein